MTNGEIQIYDNSGNLIVRTSCRTDSCLDFHILNETYINVLRLITFKICKIYAFNKNNENFIYRRSCRFIVWLMLLGFPTSLALNGTMVVMVMLSLTALASLSAMIMAVAKSCGPRLMKVSHVHTVHLYMNLLYFMSMYLWTQFSLSNW